MLEWAPCRVCMAAYRRQHCRHGSRKPAVGFSAPPIFVFFLYVAVSGVFFLFPLLFYADSVDDVIALIIGWVTSV